jgi:hypothetical protein
VPLNRIDRFEQASCLTFAYLLSIYVPFATYGESGSQEAERMQYVTLFQNDVWNKFQHYINMAKERKQSDLPSDIVIDFGPLSFLETEDRSQDEDVEKDKDTAIRRVLALGHETTLWGALLSYVIFSQLMVVILFRSCQS